MELTQEARSCGAIVLLGLAGQEAGYALADVLTGKVCPSGKLSFSWPEKLESFGLAAQQLDSFLGYRYFDTFGGELLFPFGYGLGYGKAEFSSVSVGLDGCDVTVSATVENTGETYPVQGGRGRSTVPARTAEKQVLPGSSTRSRKRRSLPRANSRRCICASR